MQQAGRACECARQPGCCVASLAHGALAQLGERLLCKHQVIGSIPIGSTTPRQPRDEDTRSAARAAVARSRVAVSVFDIVNGFFKSMPWRHAVRRESSGFRRDACRSQTRLRFSSTPRYCATLLIAEFRVGRKAGPGLSLVVWTLKREVRAIRGCLGMYRR